MQSSKGSQMGAAFGGSSQTVFGARGGQTFLAKLTTIGAIVFMVTSLLLAIVEAKKTSIIIGPKPAAQQSQAPIGGTGIPFGGAGVKPNEGKESAPAQQQKQAPAPEGKQ